MNTLNPAWIELLQGLTDTAFGRTAAITDRLQTRAFNSSWEDDSPLATAVAELESQPNSPELLSLHQMTVMHARRMAAIGMAQLDGLTSILRASHLVDVHASIAPLARSAAEHLALTGWLIDPALPARTQIARHIVHLNASRKAFQGIRSGLVARPSVQFAEQKDQAAQRAGLSLHVRSHGHPLRGREVDWIKASLAAGATLEIERPQEHSRAAELYGLLCSFSHPNIIEQLDQDQWDGAACETMVIPQPRPEIVRLSALLVARLLRTGTWMLLRLWGLEERWAEDSRAIIARL